MTHAMHRALKWDDSGRPATQVTRENSFARRSLVVLVAAGCAWSSVAFAAGGGPIKDAANRTVTVAPGVTSVVPAGPPAQVLLHALVPGLLAGLIEPFKPEHVIYVDPKVAALPQIPALSRTAAAGDIAMVSDLKPGLCVDFGTVSARYVASTEKIQKELNVPAVIFANDLTAMGPVVTGLGDVLGREARATEIVAKIDDVMGRVKALADLPEEARPRVYMARGADGLQALRAGSSFDQPVRLAGGHNVVEGNAGPFVRLGVADVVALKPAFVVFADRDALRSPLHDALPKDTIFVLDAGEPYKALTGPPSINRLTGVLALAVLLHPGKVKADGDEVKRIETTLFPIPAGLAEPAPLQVQSR